MTVRWDQPLEAVHVETGQVVPMKLAHGDQPDGYGEYCTTEAPDSTTSNSAWYADGTDRCGYRLWRIRNRQPDTLPIDRALWKRCVGLVNRMAGDEGGCVYPTAISPMGMLTPHYQEARKIAALLPVEVDPDLVVAREIAAEARAAQGGSYADKGADDYRSGKNDTSMGVLSALAALKRRGGE